MEKDLLHNVLSGVRNIGLTSVGEAEPEGGASLPGRHLPVPFLCGFPTLNSLFFLTLFLTFRVTSGDPASTLFPTVNPPHAGTDLVYERGRDFRLCLAIRLSGLATEVGWQGGWA